MAFSFSTGAAPPRHGAGRLRRRRGGGLERLQQPADRRRAAGRRRGRPRRGSNWKYSGRHDAAGRTGRQSDRGLGAQALPGYLGQVLARRMAPGDPGEATLGVTVNSNLGGGGPADPDIMRGVATLNGRQARVTATSNYSRARPTRPCRNRLCKAGCRAFPGLRLRAKAKAASVTADGGRFSFRDRVRAAHGVSRSIKLRIAATKASACSTADRASAGGGGSAL